MHPGCKLHPLSVTCLGKVSKCYVAWPMWKIVNWSTTLNENRLIYPVNRETCKVHSLLQPFEVSNYENNRRNRFSVVSLLGSSRLWRSLSRLPRFHSALKLLKNSQATQASRLHLVHSPRFIPDFIFYTQSVMVSLCFIPLSVLYSQSAFRSPQSMFYTDRE